MMKKREINDLLAILTLKPKQLYIFVEGATDESVLKNFLLKSGNSKNVSISRIDHINVNDSLLEQFQLTKNSNKNKVIALAKLIENSQIQNNSMMFIVDKDLDEILNRKLEISNLLYSDFTCLESYIFTQEHFREFFTLTNYSTKNSSDIVYLELKNILNYLFAFRIEHETQNFCLETVDYKSKCSFKGNQFKFDRESFLLQRLTTKKMESNFNEFREKIENRLNSFDLDDRNLIHGHDFEYILFLYIFLNGNRQLKKEHIENNLRTLFSDCTYLSKFPLFKKVYNFSN